MKVSPLELLSCKVVRYTHQSRDDVYMFVTTTHSVHDDLDQLYEEISSDLDASAFIALCENASRLGQRPAW